MLKDFRAFIMRGNVVDMAVGIVIGAAFGAIVSSAVADIIMPPVGLLLGEVDFSNLMVVLREGTMAGPYASLAAARDAGAVTLNYGQFINTIISFLLIAAVVFFAIVRPIGRLRAMEEKPAPAVPTARECPFCFTSIPLKATRCPNCTSQLPD